MTENFVKEVLDNFAKTWLGPEEIAGNVEELLRGKGNVEELAEAYGRNFGAGGKV